MPKWLVDGFIGWGAVAALTVIISLATDAPYAFWPTVLYGLLMGLIIGAPGGIIGGLKHEGWAWAFSGGIIAAFVVGVIYIAYQILF